VPRPVVDVLGGKAISAPVDSEERDNGALLVGGTGR
jgi:hypothetical protein